jgi:glycosyltransferase involved in cell wall biosynthesis
MDKINVLQFICPSGFYGAERWIVALANNIDPRRINCELAVTRESGSGELEICHQFARLGLPVHQLRMSNRFDFGIVNRLVKLIKERNIHVIHTHGYKSDILGVIAARKAKIKSLCTPHGFENTKDLKLRTYIWAGCQSFRFFDAVVPLSAQLMEQVKPYGIRKERLHYIQNGVDLKEVLEARDFGVKREEGQARSEKLIGFIGQMISRKNLYSLLDVFDELAQERDDIRLQLLGDGEERAELEQYSRNLQNYDRIEFLGFLNNRLDFLRNFDLFVMTSSLEGIPRCLMEAMALGIPVAAFNIPGVDQIVLHNSTGLLADFGDKKALKEHWCKLLDDKILADDLVANARKLVDKRFSAVRMATEYTQLFNKMIDPISSI